MSATGPTPTTWAVLVTAQKGRHRIEVSYHGPRWLICTHGLGWHANRPMVLGGYQTRGETISGALLPTLASAGKSFFLEEADDVVADQVAPWATAENYNRARPFSAADEILAALPGRTGSA